VHPCTTQTKYTTSLTFSTRVLQVKSGHYVRVVPDALPQPSLVVHSAAMADALGLSAAEVVTERFARFFSGDMSQAPGLESWATPYALSIMGKAQYHNCPFGNGNGYGDGRAISVGEVVVRGQRWEMQLKGGGTTPFCRGGDGRAVLRSSVRTSPCTCTRVEALTSPACQPHP
jgi:uncharacterized protein YdiU (UPF0061 family)